VTSAQCERDVIQRSLRRPDVDGVALCRRHDADDFGGIDQPRLLGLADLANDALRRFGYWPANQRHAALDDARFLECDRRNRVTKLCLVIEID